MLNLFKHHRRWLTLVLLGLAALSLSGCSQSYTWGWYVVSPTTEGGRVNLGFLASGFWNTILIAVVASVCSMTIGLDIALPGMAGSFWLRSINRI